MRYRIKTKEELYRDRIPHFGDINFCEDIMEHGGLYVSVERKDTHYQVSHPFLSREWILPRHTLVSYFIKDNEQEQKLFDDGLFVL